MAGAKIAPKGDSEIAIPASLCYGTNWVARPFTPLRQEVRAIGLPPFSL
jgi:hypothetical protein